MKNDLSYIGRNIRTVRKRKGLTLEILSGLCAVTQSHLGMVERGQTGLSIELLLALCDALDISYDTLLSEGRGKPPRPSDRLDTLCTLLRNVSDKDLDLVLEHVNLWRKYDIGR
jgi:transcriptional regulator with XRE-family HTH domain